MLPDTPALGELGIPFLYKGAWFGMMAPDGTPIELRERIVAVIREALNKPELRARFLDPQGYKVVASRPDAVAAHIKTEFESGAEIMRITGIKAQ